MLVDCVASCLTSTSSSTADGIQLSQTVTPLSGSYVRNIMPSPTHRFSLLHTVLFIGQHRKLLGMRLLLGMFVDFAQVGYLESLVRL